MSRRGWIFLALLAALHAYVGFRLLPDLPVSTAVRIAGAVALLVSFVLMPLTFIWRDRLAWAGFIAMGAFSSLFVATLLRDVALLAVLPFVGAQTDVAVSSGSAVAAVALAGLATLVGFVNARTRARIVEVDVPIAGLPTALSGFSIAQISDVHVGPTIKRPYVEAIVEAVNRLDVDLIAVTGDLVDGSVAQLASDVAPLRGLSARHGAFFVTGNHEYYAGERGWIVELRRLGLKVLENEHVVIEHGGASIVVAGVTDYSAHHFDAARRSDPGRAIAGAPASAGVKLLLAHQPRSADAAADAGFDLQLSGHTHGGQFWPWIHFVRFQQPFTSGLHRLRQLWIYVSRGTGYWGPPKRVGAPSEITRIRLVPAAPATT